MRLDKTKWLRHKDLDTSFLGDDHVNISATNSRMCVLLVRLRQPNGIRSTTRDGSNSSRRESDTVDPYDAELVVSDRLDGKQRFDSRLLRSAFVGASVSI